MLSGAEWKGRSEEHTSELQSRRDLVCRLLLEKKNDAPARPAGRLPDPEGRRADRRRRLVLWHRLPFSFTCSVATAFFFCNDTATTEIYTLPLHDALPISPGWAGSMRREPASALAYRSRMSSATSGAAPRAPETPAAPARSAAAAIWS